ncbi:hypothetical protein CC80DRAFT_503170 [Byssothecium circinans]|uniref:Ubiquitin-like protease family profile domain-containing protein n=1 Tax=Byssothecium circinans TaxID=147558 RepID=A0A6A5U375_9PLEO|nr:hypothetical protein CC80DRAFT_503170 [Byssothecium circinans]
MHERAKPNVATARPAVSYLPTLNRQNNSPTTRPRRYTTSWNAIDATTEKYCEPIRDYKGFLSQYPTDANTTATSASEIKYPVMDPQTSEVLQPYPAPVDKTSELDCATISPPRPAHPNQGSNGAAPTHFVDTRNGYTPGTAPMDDFNKKLHKHEYVDRLEKSKGRRYVIMAVNDGMTETRQASGDFGLHWTLLVVDIGGDTLKAMHYDPLSLGSNDQFASGVLVGLVRVCETWSFEKSCQKIGCKTAVHVRQQNTHNRAAYCEAASACGVMTWGTWRIDKKRKAEFGAAKVVNDGEEDPELQAAIAMSKEKY